MIKIYVDDIKLKRLILIISFLKNLLKFVF